MHKWKWQCIWIPKWVVKKHFEELSTYANYNKYREMRLCPLTEEYIIDTSAFE